VAPVTGVRVRQDVWDLGDETNPWRDPVIGAYAQGVSAMKALAQTDPAHPANWTNQAAIHERRGQKIRRRLEDQCQHACWFFLPWHRMYLYRFEQIVRSHLDASVADAWALPYWNYSDNPGRRALPPAFRQPELVDGSPNPLFTSRRQSDPLDINGGEPMTAAGVSLTDAMKPDVFSRSVSGATPGFGGGRTNPLFHHSSSGPLGPLEGTPHGTVHNQVGGASGLMSAFNTAALDPIFWLHHANIDRLWEQWRRGTPAHSNSTESDWLTMTFELVDAAGTRVSLQVGDVLEIETQLFYTYSGLPGVPAAPPAALEREELRLMGDDLPAEMVGAIDEPVVLEGAAAASTSFPVSPPSGPARESIAAGRVPAMYLNIEDVEGEANPGLLYGVYLNLPAGESADPESPHFVGVLPFFGIESTTPDDNDEEAPHRLRYVFDITDTVADLTARGDWNPAQLQVTFAPVGVGPETRLEHTPPPVQIGRVSLFVE
jgi:tyrosinase